MRAQMKRRTFTLLLLFTAGMVLLVGRLFWVQVIDGEWYRQKAFDQQNRDREIDANRGKIYDRNGKELAVSADVERIFINPNDIRRECKDIDGLVNELSSVLSLDRDAVFSMINRSVSYLVLKRRVEKDVAERVRKIISTRKITGIGLDKDSKRYYPSRNLASHVLGFIGNDNQGMDGIELMMEQYLHGVPGKILSEVDAAGREVAFSEEKRIEPQQGLNLVLTIDETIQHIVQEELQKAYEENAVANGATAIAMDPRTGDILALVSLPDFDPNAPFLPPKGEDASKWDGFSAENIKKLQETVWRDKAISDTYEPGSTFKAITSAAGLEEGVVDKFTPTDDFTITVMGKKIDCWSPNTHGNEPFYKAVENSCNPAFVKVSQGLGIDRFYKYVRTFGFYEKTGIPLPGEASGIFHKKPSEVDMAVASFGQRFQITPIQLISSYTALINGGKLMKPRLVKELKNQQDTVVKTFPTEVVRVCISKKTSDTLRDVLEGVVANGTGSNAYVSGYRVAGKTGTSETTEDGRRIASFCGFAPADNPALIVLVILDKPMNELKMGGQIAAPVAGRIFESALTYMGVDRNYSERDKRNMAEMSYVPDIRTKTITEAKSTLLAAGFEAKIESNETNEKNIIIIEQTPKPGVALAKGSVVVGYTFKPEKEVTVMVPDVRGLSIQEASKVLKGSGLNIKVLGLGLASSQSRNAGELIQKGSVIEVEFKILATH